MLAYRRIDIIIVSAGSTPAAASRVLVCWELVTQHSGLDHATFSIERSLSPGFADDEYDVIVSGIQGAPGTLLYEYVDVTPNLMSLLRNYYYRIRATTAEGEILSETRTWETKPRPHEAEIIRRHDFVLQYMQGVPSFVFIERTADSQPCVCFDRTAGRPRVSNCSICLGTGRYRPFFSPIPLYVDYNPDQNMVNISNFGELQPNEKDCWFSAYPPAKPGDVLYEVVGGILWRIVSINTIQPMKTTVQHICRLMAITRDKVEYTVLPQQIPEATIRGVVQEWERIKEERMF